MFKGFVLALTGLAVIYFLSGKIWTIEDKAVYAQSSVGISGYEHVKVKIIVPTVGPLEFKTISVDCPSKKRLLGGVFDSDRLRDISIRATRLISIGDHDRYEVVFRNMKDKYLREVMLTATAICAYAQ
jgi:hypothetical protein